MITPGDLTVGDFITIESWVPWDRNVETATDGNPFAPPTLTKVRETDGSWCGEVFEVASIALPFIILHHHSKYPIDRFNRTFDTRKVRLMELPDDYVKEWLELPADSELPHYIKPKIK